MKKTGTTTIIATEASIHTDSTENSIHSSITPPPQPLITSIPIHIPKQSYIFRTPQISIQMWDTAGKERFISESTRVTSGLGDSFFRYAHVAVLIYDATSSRSFLQLMKWYSDLLDRIKKVKYGDAMKYKDVYYDDENEADEHEKSDFINSAKDHSVQNGCNTTFSKEKQQQQHKFPVLIVATKLDRVKAELSNQARKKIVPQRSVLGLKGKVFKGHDYHYEYSVRSNDEHSHVPSRSISSDQTKNDLLSGGNEPLSYGFENGTWTTDHEYRDCLRAVEDECFPDRYMVLLWCKRNGLKHVEISALDGTGEYKNMNAMILYDRFDFHRIHSFHSSSLSFSQRCE